LPFFTISKAFSKETVLRKLFPRARQKFYKISIMTQILEGKTLSAQIRSGLSARVAFCASKLGRAPKLVGISWQGDYAGFLYLNKEADAARKLGIAAEIREVDDHTTAEEFFAIVRHVSQDETVDAVLIPRPLPPALNNLDIAPFLNPAQDIDGSGLVCYYWP
jgi:methylenetetrahydrofolate dehydrogenase (NADP+)/methenyltetrahydrofolate cyclohydrolase